MLCNCVNLSRSLPSENEANNYRLEVKSSWRKAMCVRLHRQCCWRESSSGKYTFRTYIALSACLKLKHFFSHSVISCRQTCSFLKLQVPLGASCLATSLSYEESQYQPTCFPATSVQRHGKFQFLCRRVLVYFLTRRSIKLNETVIWVVFCVAFVVEGLVSQTNPLIAQVASQK